ncbi:hypothetical protein BV25DRAFT_214971 [Artomyces pyxidatus]|uniref:Uncharacterized protein n=1 Tax=Artomyces pyxidatus TaxID=48021 RepID=A0ACB8T921_9AGAM|nr:hypothetical protein BV25DRAFT_214971 [Artomyces pyxidatus]
MALQTRPEPMNASPYHSKVKVQITLSDPFYIAGGAITGKMELECKADKGLGIGVIMVELFAIEELTSRDHSATSTFLRTRRLYQGPGLPPSNAVMPHPIAGEPPLPAHHHQARRGLTTFLFRLPVPSTSPSSIDFGSGLATIKYEVRATIGVSWKGENRLVTDKKEVDIVEKYEEDFERVEPEGVIVGEHGKVWVQGKVVGGLLVAGESACVELQVKNHSSKKSTGLSITLTRHLHLPSASASQKPPLQISDTLTTVNFRGPEYIAHPGTEGVAQLVFDVPRMARTVSTRERHGEDEEYRKEALFGVRCTVNIKMAMPIGSKDIFLDLPVIIFHPATLPPPPPLPVDPYIPYGSPLYDTPLSPPPMPALSPAPFLDRAQSPYAYPLTPPPQQVYYDQGQVWFPHPAQSPFSIPYITSPPPVHLQSYYPHSPMVSPYDAVPRPSSAEPAPSQPLYNLPSGLPAPAGAHPLLPLTHVPSEIPVAAEPEEGKGERASRFTHHLRMTSRHRSVSPQSHRFPVPSAQPIPQQPLGDNAIPPPTRSQLKLSLIDTPKAAGLTPSAVLSPRPMPSPKLTYREDPFTHLSLTKSERVQALERMAADVEKENRDLSGEINLGQNLNVDKTLPGPPVPSGKDRVQPAQRPRADMLFPPGDSSRSAVYNGPAPKTPTLSALTLLKPPRGALANQGPSSAHGETGLDALERRLLAEVGTRKLDQEPRRPDVRAVLPIAIPRPGAVDDDAVNDSAISSLTLGADVEQDYEAARARPTGDDAAILLDGTHEHEHEHEIVDRISDERTQKQGRGRGSNSHSGESERGTRKGKARSAVSSDKGRTKSKKNKQKDGRDEEAVKLRKAAKGRVAEWLGKIQTDVPPGSDPSPVHSPRSGSPVPESPTVPNPVESLPVIPATTEGRPVRSRKNSGQDVPSVAGPSSPAKAANAPITENEQKDVSSAPNPRSSGFVPIAALRERKEAAATRSRLPAPSAVANPSTSPISARARFEAAIKATPAPVLKRDVPQPKKLNGLVEPRFPVFKPLPNNSPAKYDVRSARGGRGGKVSSVAAIWASGGTPAKPDLVAPAAKPLPRDIPPAKPKALLGMAKVKPGMGPIGPLRTSPLSSPSPFSAAKATSSPAAVSSSLASPMLSSTASLSLPALKRDRPAPRVPPPVVEVRAVETGKTATPPVKTGADLAFGQARLRDLIKKYQGQTA